MDYLRLVCRAPYNLDPPPDALEYLLGNGRAVVLLDGLDELVEPELRKRFVRLVDGFVARFPLVPVVVTARRIGYLDAPLDSRMFTVGVVAELNTKQVEQYVRRWFALDESTAVADRDRMAHGFITESTAISDLRSNPLLLSLLCAMYSSEHYIPANMAQVYERCAVMLFDRWDVMRGISAAPQFQGRLRAAVQHLAWQLFTAKESGKALPRHRIVRQLTEHLVAKQFDEDAAIATAETFVDFCTGRAWVLTDVGATETEPRYAFAHRTFLEFFAAEHLVRTNPTAERLWSVLRPHVLATEWEVVAQIAVQLLERNVDGGADDILRLVLRDSDPRNWILHTFAARTLRHIHPGHQVIRDITVAALRAMLAPEVSERFFYWKSGFPFGAFVNSDAAFYTLIGDCSPGNLPAVGRAVAATLETEVEAGNDAALLAVMVLPMRSTRASDHLFWAELHTELEKRYADAITEWATRAPWPLLISGAGPARIVTRFGAQPLYLFDEVLLSSRPTAVQRILNHDRNADARLWQLLLAAPRPWIDDTRWWTQLAEAVQERSQQTEVSPAASWLETPLILLVLPYLEMSELAQEDPLLTDPDIATIQSARLRGDPLGNLLRKQQYPPEVAHFLTRWARKEFDLVRHQNI